MAAFMGHVLSTVGPKILSNSTKTLAIIPCRNGSYNKKVKKRPRQIIKRVPFESRVESLKSRGFMRNLPSYNPPEGVTDKLRQIFEEIVGTTELTYELDTEKKCKLLTHLNNTFSHVVPNSLLHTIRTLGDVFEFYHTPNTNITPYDHFKDMELPPNLHITYDYTRFHPDTDTRFGGVTAFPKSSTIISSLKLKKKYKGHSQETPWHDI